MKKISVFWAIIANALCAQGQWGEPVNLGPNINSPRFEFGLCLTQKEDTIIFDSTRPGGKGEYDLWFSCKEKGDWAAAKNIGDSINTRWNEDSPFLSPDGRFLYFSSDRPNGSGNYDIYVSQKKNGVWQTPWPLAYPINTPYSEGWPCLSADGNQLYFTSDRHGGKGHLDLWISEKRGGKWTDPANLGDSVNGPGWESSPSISADGNELYFRRDTVTGTKPSAIWHSVKINGAWQKAAKMEPPVNGGDIRVASPFLTRDGKRIYFNSDRKPSQGLTDIFVSERKEGGKP